MCQGDSGGPLTLVSEGAHTLVGVVSHGGQAAASCGQVAHRHPAGVYPHCSQSPYDVFMKVSAYLPWIKSTVLANGGLASCDYFLSAPPKLGTQAFAIP